MQFGVCMLVCLTDVLAVLRKVKSLIHSDVTLMEVLTRQHLPPPYSVSNQLDFFLRSCWYFVKTSLKSLLNLSQCCFCFMFSPRGTWALTSPSRDQIRMPCIEGKISTTGPLCKSFQSAVFSWFICLHCQPLSQLPISFFSGETKHLQSRCPATGKISDLILGQFPYGPQTTQNTLSCLATYRLFFFFK